MICDRVESGTWEVNACVLKNIGSSDAIELGWNLWNPVPSRTRLLRFQGSRFVPGGWNLASICTQRDLDREVPVSPSGHVSVSKLNNDRVCAE
jgi:hypothetical protein